MRLHTALVSVIDGGTERVFVRRLGVFAFPSQRQVCGANNLDEVHEVESLLAGLLLGVVEGVDVVVRPATEACIRMFAVHIRNHSIAELRPEAKLVDLVRESVGLVLEVVLEVVNVHVAVGERLSGRNVEVSDDFVDTDVSLQAASLPALLVEVLGVVLTFTLFHTFAATKRPRDGGVGITDFVAGVAAAGLDRVRGRGCAETFTAVVGVEMRGFIGVSVS